MDFEDSDKDASRAMRTYVLLSHGRLVGGCGFFTVFGPIIYIAWGLLLAFGTVCAAIIACAFERNPPRRRW